MKIQNWKINEQKSKKNNVHKTVYFVSSNSNQNSKNTSNYQGDWKNDMKNGFGDFTYKNGDLYSGQWIDNFRQGNGTLWSMNNRKKLQRSYVGEWSADKKDGRGTMYYPNGDKYEGFWFRDQKTGFGVYVFSNNDIYIGSWRNDKKNGYGVFLKDNKDIFEGIWVDDLKEGPGSYQFFMQKKILIGEWFKDNLKSGLYSQLHLEQQHQKLELDNFNNYLEVINPEEILKKQFQLIQEMRDKSQIIQYIILYTYITANIMLAFFILIHQAIFHGCK